MRKAGPACRAAKAAKPGTREKKSCWGRRVGSALGVDDGWVATLGACRVAGPVARLGSAQPIYRTICGLLAWQNVLAALDEMLLR